MTDLSKTIAPKSDQINADDLIGGPKTITVSDVSLCSEPDQPVAIRFEGDNGKPYKPCKSMRRVLVHIWGADGKAYVGRSMTLYRDDKVTFGGMAVGGIRISHMSHIDKPMTMALTATRANRKAFTVNPLQTPAPAADKAKIGTDALVKRIQEADSMAALEAITADQTVVSQRAYLTSKRPELAERVTQAITDALALYETTDPFAGEVEAAE